ncbi:hypothetical protein DFP75_101652 [Marinomonas alcarazii]|uniref:Uncharacterized protein n=1 Tax=Marinomonas alcarazii TaxID=491949 RepID=A0A318V945_9GAMM|nr:hypothetical protein DFP75_101652 [Marinomonas alcarazii]
MYGENKIKKLIKSLVNHSSPLPQRFAHLFSGMGVHVAFVQSIPALLVLLAAAGEFTYIVAGELDDNVIAEVLAPTLYGAFNLSGSDEKWFVRQIALRLSCPTSDIV